jgi:hypothetical protein
LKQKKKEIMRTERIHQEIKNLSPKPLAWSKNSVLKEKTKKNPDDKEYMAGSKASVSSSYRRQ